MRLTSEELYFRDLDRYPVLTDEQERNLVMRVQKKVPGSSNTLVTANLRFVVSVARRYRNRGLSYLDLINEGNLGLIKAAERFDFKMNVKFISYAVWWIRQSIQKALFEQVGTVRIPLNKVALFRNFRRALDTNKGDYYDTISMDSFKTHETDIVEIMDKIKSVSLDTPISTGGQNGHDSPLTLEDVIGNEPNQDGDTAQRELGSVLDSVLQNVPSRDERILRMYFGLNFSRQFTLEEIGREFHLTRERVRLIRDKALRKLMHNPASRQRLSPFLQDFQK
ncbi:MAG: RNA polymerase sigma factor RpoD/SigA [Chitinispirillaceae bacterium]|jgi:RNA polymerase primary sigma factor|nr:RNA polymerase sigma factor RpoD/SigA [Chitinispirillaceae bacterium]